MNAKQSHVNDRPLIPGVSLLLMLPLLGILDHPGLWASQPGTTRVSIKENRWFINGRITYPGSRVIYCA